MSRDPNFILRWNAPIQFWSAGDEKSFFFWLESINGVTRIEGVGGTLNIHLRSKRISKVAQREFVAIYKRYGGDYCELAPYLTSADWPELGLIKAKF